MEGTERRMTLGRRPRARRASFVALAVVTSLTVAFSEPLDAARRTTRKKVTKATTTAVAPAVPTATTLATTTTTSPPAIGAATITQFAPATGSVRLVLQPPSRPDLTASVTIDAIGFEESTRTLTWGPGVLDQTIPVTLNLDSQYTFRVKWAAPDGTTGAEDSRSVAPYFPQPKYRGPVPVAGQGWSVLFTSDFVPTRRNPCAPIEVFYDTTNQQLDLSATVQSAIAQASAASGVEMKFVGAGRVRPTTPRVLIIDWVTGQTDWLGVARQAQQKDARGVFWRTTLSISLASSRGVARGRWETIILHELGHILGLQHSHDPTSLMFSPAESKGSWPWVTTVFTEGDRRGLQAVNAGASGGCSPSIAPTDLWNGQQGP